MNHEHLTHLAFTSLKNFLVNVAKSNPTEQQLHALYALMDNFSRLAFGDTTGRYAWALPVGCGKTQSACHWIASMLKANTGHSVVVACGQVNALNDINRTLVHDLHIDQSLVGTMVSHDKASEVTGQRVFSGQDVPVLLVTHARVHMGDDELSRYWNYQGRERGLLIYDESLISSKSVIVDGEEVLNAFDIFSKRLERGDITQVNAQFYTQVDLRICDFHQSIKKVKRQIAEWRQSNPDPTTPVPNDLRYTNLTLAPFDSEGRFTDDLATVKAQKWSKPLRAFFDLCGTTVRIVCTELGEAVLSFDITVPEDIKNMVILDASSPIRLLSKIDKHKIIEAESLPLVQKANITNLADLFDYTNVAWYVYRAGGGYKAFQRDKGNTRIKDAVNLLKSIPKEDAVLFYVFKKRKDDDKKDLPKILRDELTKQGYDLTNGQVCIETFGRETSLNSYSHCRHVIFVGTPWQNMNDLVATALGQHRDINKHLEDDLLRDLDLTEVAYRYHQAAGRGSCRKNGPDGRPQKMAVYCFLQDHQRDALMPYLKTVLPGMQTPAKRPQKKFQKEGKIEAAVAVLLEKLSPKVGICPKQGDCFSITALKRGCCGLSVSANKFTQALEIALKSSPGWSRQGRSLVFKPAM